ncbi:MAG: ribose 5-phosphate isomerase B [Actinomycetota bacterium]|nr:ribose 5-phosphate isomerase B [Actinomycetota bacterium]
MPSETRIPGRPSSDDVRAMVSRIVDGVLGDEPIEAEQSPAEMLESSGDDIAIGADHGGYPLKERLVFRLREQGHSVLDCGTDSLAAVDYPDFAHAVASAVSTGKAQYGIIVDGAGIGSAVVANKVPGIRAALCYDLSTARNSREHNHANVLTMGAGLIGENLGWQIVQEWLSVEWGGDRHARRVDKITEIERRYSKA